MVRRISSNSNDQMRKTWWYNETHWAELKYSQRLLAAFGSLWVEYEYCREWASNDQLNCTKPHVTPSPPTIHHSSPSKKFHSRKTWSVFSVYTALSDLLTFISSQWIPRTTSYRVIIFSLLHTGQLPPKELLSESTDCLWILIFEDAKVLHLLVGEGHAERQPFSYSAHLLLCSMRWVTTMLNGDAFLQSSCYMAINFINGSNHEVSIETPHSLYNTIQQKTPHNTVHRSGTIQQQYLKIISLRCGTSSLFIYSWTTILQNVDAMLPSAFAHPNSKPPLHQQKLRSSWGMKKS